MLTIVVDDNGRGLPVEEHETVLGRFSAAAPQHRAAPALGLALVAQQADIARRRIELSDGPLGGLRATLTVSTSPEPADGFADAGPVSGRARTLATARQPSSSIAVDSEATTMKLGAVPAEVALRNSIPITTVHTQTATPGGDQRCRAPPAARRCSQPTAVPARNGHAVSATPATVSPSAWLRLPIAQNTSTQTTSATSATARPRPRTTLSSA